MTQTTNTAVTYKVELTNDNMPQRDDSAYDVKHITYWTRHFECKKEAKKFFKQYAKENNMLVFYNEASGNGKILSTNF